MKLAGLLGPALRLEHISDVITILLVAIFNVDLLGGAGQET